MTFDRLEADSRKGTRIMTEHFQGKRPREWGISFGVLPTGTHNAITDVKGVKVGQVTLIDDAKGMRTGVTAILPHDGNPSGRNQKNTECAGKRNGIRHAEQRMNFFFFIACWKSSGFRCIFQHEIRRFSQDNSFSS